MVYLILAAFAAGYAAIALEGIFRVNKAAVALLTGVACWTIYMLMGAGPHDVVSQLIERTGEFSGILFFLMGAMTIVELIDGFGGFDVITRALTIRNARVVLWIVALLTFFLSAVLDNLTTAIVMVTVITKLVTNQRDRLLMISIAVIAANAGGVWSPIGDVTTTMLWIGGQITSLKIIHALFLPSLVNVVVPVAVLTPFIKGNVEPTDSIESTEANETPPLQRYLVLCFGFAILLLVPVFKTITHLPPFMGILAGLGILWTLTEIMHNRKHSNGHHGITVAQALQRIDIPSILFFLGILLSIAALQSAGILGRLATMLDAHVPNQRYAVMLIGLVSAIVDNVPLVAASMGMYNLSQLPTDHHFWHFLAYCAGTGGSTLIIGSAAGVAAMGMAKIDFFWYVKRITPLAVLGYFCGAIVYLALSHW